MNSRKWTFGSQRKDRQEWNEIYQRISNVKAAAEIPSAEVELLLQRLMKIELPCPRITPEDYANMLSHFCQIVPVTSDLLCSEFESFLSKCQDSLDSSSAFIPWQSDQVHQMLEFSLHFLQSCNSWYAVQAIRFLGIVLEKMQEILQIVEVRVLYASIYLWYFVFIYPSYTNLSIYFLH